MPRHHTPLPPPGMYPRFAELGDVARFFSNDRITHGIPPGTHWFWFAFPEAWPMVSPDEGNYTGPGTPLGEQGDLWWFTIAELAAQQPGALPEWLVELLARQVARWSGPLMAAFLILGEVPLLWEVPTYPEPRMAAYQPHYRLAFGGPLCVVEQWSCRLNITSATTLPDSAEADAMLPDLVDAISTWVASSGANLSAATELSWVKFNEINALGHYVDADNSRVSEVNPAVAGYGTLKVPPQVAIVVSLRTAHARGKAHAGRMYTPALFCAPTSAGLGNDYDAIVTAATLLLNTINGVVTPAGVSIISATGESNAVTRVAVGKVFDTMRTRRRGLAEEYTLGAVLA